MEEDVLILEAIEYKDDKVAFKVAHQMYRKDSFFQGNCIFQASNGVKLYSIIFPKIQINENEIELCLRGEQASSDEEILTCTLEVYLRIVEAVKEYNEKRLKEDKNIHNFGK